MLLIIVVVFVPWFIMISTCFSLLLLRKILSHILTGFSHQATDRQATKQEGKSES